MIIQNKRPFKNTCKLANSSKEFAIEIIEDDSDNIEIEIIDINEYYNDEFSYLSTYELVHANFHDRLYTFYGCNRKSSNRFKSRYKVEGYFEGRHVVSLDQLLVKSYTFSIPRPLLKIFETDFNNRKLDDLYEESIEINSNFKIKYRSSLVKNLSDVNNFSYKHYLSSSFQFLFQEGVKLTEVFNYLNIFKQFLDFNISSEVSLIPSQLIICKNDAVSELDFKLKHPHNNLAENKVFMYTKTWRFKSNSKIDDKILDKKSNNAFFSDYGLNDKYIFKILKTWYNKEIYRTTYYFYIDSNDWLHNAGRFLSNVMFNNRFLNMIQALENFHKVHFNEEKVDNEDYNKNTGKYLNKLDKYLRDHIDLNEWVRFLSSRIKAKIDITLVQRLNRLLTYTEDVTFEVNFIDYSVDAKNFRHNLSHGDLDEINLGGNLELRYYQSKYLLLCCILKSLNLPIDLTNRVIQNNFNSYNIRDSIQQLSNIK
ncbi:MAG: hypothetical protein ACJARX_001111 [Psychroserpens sp.]|jgi:hypothetical protein|uniref:HEPN domain-containing protein n=1 Tax=Psychroserpens sp. TaxID=2020870 RepID=UPI0039E6706A